MALHKLYLRGSKNPEKVRKPARLTSCSDEGHTRMYFRAVPLEDTRRIAEYLNGQRYSDQLVSRSSSTAVYLIGGNIVQGHFNGECVSSDEGSGGVGVDYTRAQVAFVSESEGGINSLCRLFGVNELSLDDSI
ncbi:MAG: hypothetical protein ABIF88_02010 [archaeon]